MFEALKAGSIDLYPDYTGTLAAEILKLPPGAGLDAIQRALAPLGLGAAIPLGFENTYALAVSDTRPPNLRRLSDLADSTRARREVTSTVARRICSSTSGVVPVSSTARSTADVSR